MNLFLLYLMVLKRLGHVWGRLTKWNGMGSYISFTIFFLILAITLGLKLSRMFWETTLRPFCSFSPSHTMNANFIGFFWYFLFIYLYSNSFYKFKKLCIILNNNHKIFKILHVMLSHVYVMRISIQRHGDYFNDSLIESCQRPLLKY